MTSAALPDLLKWSVQNSEASRQNSSLPIEPPKTEALAALFGFNVGSDAETMAEALHTIKNESGTNDLERRVDAWQDFQMLVENLDNANNLQNIQQHGGGPRGLWMPLLEQLDSEEAEMRSWAALCCHSAVQNNEKTQEKLLVIGGIPKLVQLATADPDTLVRKRAITAVSSSLKNYPPALDTIIDSMPAAYKPENNIDATDMDSVDAWIQKLKTDLL